MVHSIQFVYSRRICTIYDAQAQFLMSIGTQKCLFTMYRKFNMTLKGREGHFVHNAPMLLHKHKIPTGYTKQNKMYPSFGD